MICASTTISRDLLVESGSSEIKDYVYKELRSQLGSALIKDLEKHMNIKETRDALTDTVTYTAIVDPYTAYNTSSNTITVAGYNGVIGSSMITPVQKNLRVVEYTKSGKITRVELQFYDEHSDDWIKVPRIQLEE